jgi:hypothetical protein
VVIAVNQATKVFDDVCIAFSRNFYNSLLKGHSPRKAFDLAKNRVITSNMELLFCCCHHEHKSDCCWFVAQRSRDYFDNPHGLHKRHNPDDCNCDKWRERNAIDGPQSQLYHKVDCKYKDRHYKKLDHLDKLYNNSRK